MKQLLTHLRSLMCGIVITCSTAAHALITTLNYADPQPLYTAHYPYTLLAYSARNYGEGIYKTPGYDNFCVSFMPFYQRANTGTNFNGISHVAIGNIPARMNMIAILPYNTTTQGQNCSQNVYTNTNTDLPCGQTTPTTFTQTRDQLLYDICQVFATSNPVATTPTQLTTIEGLIQVQQSNPNYENNMGMYDNQMKYRKYGVRFNVEAMLGKGFGFTVCTGIASLNQTPQLIDQTQNAQTPVFNPTGSATSVTAEQWKAVLGYISIDDVAKIKELGRAVNLDVCAYDRTSIEDIYIDLFWRGLFQAQRNPQRIPGLGYKRWDSYFAIPFASIGGTIATGKKKNQNILFSLPFGNNGHNAVRLRAGLCIDFFDAFEFCGEIGFTHFDARWINNLRIPNNIYQMNFYPYATAACVRPGSNWHASIGMYAYNFNSTISATFLYAFVHHSEDKIRLTDCQLINNPNQPVPTVCSTTAFDVEGLMCRSAWLAQVINGSLCCEISPNARLLGMIQIPVAQRNAYRSSTYGLSFEFGY
jgi:hypothetical protein